MAPARPTHDYYVTLQIRRSATCEEIKKSYRLLARLYHPDKNRSADATAKTQLINEAWETLGDKAKRIQYDITYHASASTAANDAHPHTSKPTSTAYSGGQQPPQPNTSTKGESRAQAEAQAQAEARLQAESRRRRQEWLDWERLQEQSIRHCQNQVKALEAEITALNIKITDTRAKLANDIPYWWNVFASKSNRLSEEDKNELRHKILGNDAAVRIKEVPLNKEKARLQRLKDDLSKRQSQEKERVAAEFRERQNKERIVREKAEAEARKRAAEEVARQQAAARAARAKAEAEEKLRYHAQLAKQQAAREAREKAVKEEAARAESERQKMAAAWKKREEEMYKAARANTKKESSTPNARKPTSQRQNQERSCKHKWWWNKIGGGQNCEHCTQRLVHFGYQCSGCSTIGCGSCMRELKAGRTPAINNTHRQHHGNARTNRGNGNPSSSTFPYPPRDTYNYGDDDYYDWD